MITIGQLAGYAGVTIKAVRHYHQRGLLDEPPRDSSGYRRYTAEHAIQLVKIKTLAEAGVPLARVKDLLAADPGRFAEAIGEIDRTLAERAEELVRSRERIAQLRAGDGLFVSAEVAGYLDQLRELGVSQRSVQMERDGWILMQSASPKDAAVWIADKIDAMRDPEFRAIYLEYDAAFGWSPDDPRIGALAERTERWLASRYRGPGTGQPVRDPAAAVARLVETSVGESSPAWARLTEIGRKQRAVFGSPGVSGALTSPSVEVTAASGPPSRTDARGRAVSPRTGPRMRVYPRAAASRSRSALISEYESRIPNALQRARLASMAGVPAAEVAGKSIATLKNELAIDPILFNFELVCGQVVKVDPATGVKYPVPGATVNVYDLVCHWLWFFPPDWPWSWGFRLPECVSELIGSVVTDACGDFCILIPRWDIEWIRVWIQERWCLPEILRRPSVADLLLPNLPAGAAGTRTAPPDPSSLAGLLDARTDLAAAIGPSAVQAIRDAARGHVVGAPATGLSQVLASPAFNRAVPAPVPAELRALSPAEAMRSLSSRLGLPPAKGELDLAASYGPFPRCFDIEVPIWVPFYSVPDISFQVTQQIGGTQQVIYDGAFDAGWAAHPLFQDVELDVAQFAVASPFPGCQPQGIGCENEPAIVQIGYLDVNPSYLDPATGFAVRMNKDSGGDVPSTAPFQGVLPLFGCAPDAQFYRVMASYADSSGLVFDSSGSVVPLPASAFGPALPVIAPAWQVSRIVGGVPELSAPIVPDADGWYSTDYLSWEPQNLLVNWSPIDGVYQLTAETGTGSPGSVTPTGSSSPAVVLVVDTSRPVIATFTPTSWNYVGGTPNPFTSDDGCFIIERTRADVEVNVAYSVTATHLHSVYLVPDGCDTTGVTVTNTGGLVVEPPLSNDLRYIYDGPADNSIGGTVTYKIGADAANGCYSWTLTAFSRAFTPNDSFGLTDMGGFAWNYTQTWIWSNALTSVGVITTG